MSIQFNSTPIQADAFSRGMLAPFAKRRRNGVGFSALFRNHSYFPDNDIVDIQIQKTNVAMALMVNRGEINPDFLDKARIPKAGFTEISRTFPLILRTGDISQDQLRKRGFGERAYSPNGTMRSRARKLAAQAIALEEESVVQTCEYLAAQSITNSKQVSLISQSLSGATYDFKREAAGKKTFAVDWATSATATCDLDMDNACDQVITVGRGRPNVNILGLTKYKEWQKTAEFATKMNTRWRNQFGNMNSKVVPSEIQYLVDAGFEYHFDYETEKGRNLHILTYEHTYHPANDTDFNSAQPFMDPDTMIILDTNGRFDACWGPPSHMAMLEAKQRLYMDFFGLDIESVGMSIPNIPDGFNFRGFSWNAYQTDFRGSGVTVECECAPIYVTTNPDMICTTKESW